MDKKFYIFYDNSGVIKSVGRVCEEDGLNQFEIERELALQFLQGVKNIRNFKISVIDNQPKFIEKEETPKKATYTDVGFVQLENLHEYDDPDLTITYYKSKCNITFESKEPFEKDTRFYITPKNNPVKIIDKVMCEKGSTFNEIFCDTDLISIISWSQTGNKILYLEF